MRNFFKRKSRVDETFYALRGYTYEQVEVELLKVFKKQNMLRTFHIYLLIPSSLGQPDKWMADRDRTLLKHRWTRLQFVAEYLRGQS
jgi:hypothetical protein